MNGVGGAGGMYGNVGEPGNRGDLNFGDMGFNNNPLVTMALQAGLGKMLGLAGMRGSQFFPTQNLYDQRNSQQYWQSRQAIMTEAAQADRQTYVRMMQGAAKMSGTPWGHDQINAANTLAGDVAYIAPYVAQMMPETFDAMHGSRGSAVVASMAYQRAGRTMVDPVTGRTGLSAASAGGMARNIHQQFFGDSWDPAAWKGMSSGQAGLLQEDLMARGLGGRSIGTYARDEQIDMMTRTRDQRRALAEDLATSDPKRFRDMLANTERRTGVSLAGLSTQDQASRLADTEGAAAEAMRNLQSTDFDGFSNRLRQFDARKTASRIQNLSGAVSAMRDIFGDMGRPNAPMAELVEGLNQMTQGGLATMSSGRLEQTVRTSYALAKSTGMGMDAMMGLTAQGSAMAMRMGLDPSMGISATQGAAAFGAAFGQVGRGDLPAWGNADKERLTLIDQQLRVRASGSAMADRLAATVRYAEMVNPRVGGAAGALAEALKRGESTYVDPATGQRRSVAMNEGEWRRVMTSSGVDAGTANEMLGDGSTNQEFIEKYGIGDMVRTVGQRRDVQGFIGQQYRRGVRTGLRSAGMDRATIERIEGGLGRGMADVVMNLSAEDRADPKRMNQAVVNAIRQDPRRFGMTEADLARLSDDQLTQMAELGRGNMSEALPKSQFGGYRTYQAMLQAMDKDTLARQKVVMDEAKASASVQSQMAGLGRAAPLARLMDTLQNPPEDWGTAVAEAFGGIVNPEILQATIQGGLSDDAITGLDAKGRLSLMTEEYMKQAEEYKNISADPNLSAAEKSQRFRSVQQGMNALEQGGDAAATALSEGLSQAGLVDADMTRLPELVKAGKLSQAEADRLTALRVAKAGGMRRSLDDAGIPLDGAAPDLAKLGAQGREHRDAGAKDNAATGDAVAAATSPDTKTVANQKPEADDTGKGRTLQLAGTLDLSNGQIAATAITRGSTPTVT